MILISNQVTIPEYTILKKINQDGPTTTYLAYKSNQIQIINTIVVINISNFTQVQISQLEAKFKLLSKYNIRQIQKFISYHKYSNDNQEYIYIIFQYFDGLPLIQIITQLSNNNIIMIHNQLCLCIKKLCMIGNLVHGNINPYNILINKYYHICIINPYFLENKINPDRYYYLAPEQLLLKQARYKSDHWSIGVILLEMVLAKSLQQLRKQNSNGIQSKYQIREQQLLLNSNKFKSEIRSLLHTNPSKRDTKKPLQIEFVQVQKQKFVRRFSNKKIYLSQNDSQYLFYLKDIPVDQIQQIHITNILNSDLLFFKDCRFYDVKKLQLSNNNIVSCSYLDFTIFQQLEYLSLNQNNITDLKPLIRVSSNIKELYLKKNLISCFSPLKKMNLQNLKKLWIGHNFWYSLEDITGSVFKNVSDGQLGIFNITDYSGLLKLNFSNLTYLRQVPYPSKKCEQRILEFIKKINKQLIIFYK